MSIARSKFFSCILEECFGETVRQVAEPLFHHGPLVLRDIVTKTTVPLKPLRESLQVLIQHNLVTFSVRTGTTNVVYHLDANAVLSLFNYARYCRKVESVIGKESKALFLAVLRTGRIPLSKLLFLVGSLQLKEQPSSKMSEVIAEHYSVFEQLVKGRYLIRCDKLVMPASADVPVFEAYMFNDAFTIPKVCFKTICADVQNGKKGVSEVTGEDDDILWRVNLSQFDAEIKEDLLTKAVEERTADAEMATVFRTLLHLGLTKSPSSDTTSATSFPEIKRSLLNNAKDGECNVSNVDECLKLLAMDSLGVVTKVNDLNGGNFSVNVKESFRTLTIGMMEKIVESRFGPTTARVFRLVRRLGYAEQDKLTQKAMMSSKLGRSLLYKLVEANFVTLKEIRKTYTIASSLTNKAVAFVFYVDTDTILRSLLEESYKASVNAKIRYKAEMEKHKRLLDKEVKIDKILFNMKKASCTNAQLDEVKEMLTYPERKILSRVHKMLQKLISAQLHAHQTIFIINTYFQYK